MRLFAALLPAPEALEDLEELLEPRRASADFRWAAPHQVHLTLAFYPDVAEDRLDDLVEALAATAARRRLGRARITGGGAFPSVAAARVLHAGIEVDRPDELDLLARGARAAAGRAGAAVDGQRFRPHLTLGRLRAPAEVTRWVRLLDGYAGPWWSADRVALVASYLGEGPRGRPRHEVVGEVDLGE